MRSRSVLALLLALSLRGFAAAATPTVVFLSDFGVTDDAVAICKGVMLGIEPRLQIVDLTHQVTPFAIRDGARLLASTAPYYPSGTVFLTVIDPGVGTARKPMVARTKRGQLFVLPDNGLITLVAARDGLDGAREITRTAWMRGGARSSTFHGRDVFAPVAAHLARGEDWREVGPSIEDPVRLELKAARIDGEALIGEIIAQDGPYGNLLTNVDAALFEKLGYARGDTVTVRIGERQIALPFARTFGDVAEGKPLLYFDSRDHVGLAINKGSFAAVYGVAIPAPLTILRPPH
jgi:hypothetical protein